MPSINSLHVFISYVREDQRTVNKLRAELARHGIAVWLDRERIRPGERWEIAVRRAIEEGAFFIACFSRAYDDRGKSYMNVELTMAIEQLRLRPLNPLGLFRSSLKRALFQTVLLVVEKHCEVRRGDVVDKR